VVDGAAVPGTSVPFVSALTQATGTVLVADDDPSIQQLAAAILRRAGFEVVLASDGDEALRYFTETPDRFRIAILDLSMPRVDGVTALRSMRRIRPGFAAIFFTGHSAQEASGEYGADGPTAFVQKPFAPESLIEHVLRLTK
jgi:CheY-like chemotaxis protein